MSDVVIWLGVWLVVSIVAALIFGALLEADRLVRFPTVADKTPRATASRRQLRAWRRDRLVLPANRSRS